MAFDEADPYVQDSFGYVEHDFDGQAAADGDEPIVGEHGGVSFDEPTGGDQLSYEEEFDPGAASESVAGKIRRRRLESEAESRRLQTAVQELNEIGLIDTAPQSRDELVTIDDLAPEYEDFDTIDWIRDAEYDRMARERFDEWYAANKTWYNSIKRGLFRGQAWIYVSCVAVLTALFAVFIDLVIDFLQDIRQGYCNTTWYFARKVCCAEVPIDQPCEAWSEWPEAMHVTNSGAALFVAYFMYCLWACVYASVAAWLVTQFAPRAAGSGIPELKSILGGFVIRSYTSTQTLVVKAFGLILAVSGGLNLGKEGPMAHIGAATVDVFKNIFPKYGLNEAKKREIISAACSCGVSVAFGAPIGGVLFSLEEASYYFPHKTMWRAFFAAALAALCLQAMNPTHTNRLVLYSVTYAHGWKWAELPIFVLLGALGGVVGKFFIVMNLRLMEVRKQTAIRNWPVTEAVVVALITAMTSYFNEYTRAGSGEMVATLFRPCPAASAHHFEILDICIPDSRWAALGWLALAFLTKVSLIIMTYGIKVPAGLFVPSLIMGALLGRIVGIVVQQIFLANPEAGYFWECQGLSNCIEPGIYALIGGAAVLGGVTRVTISLVVLVFELTGDPQFIIPIMITVLMSKWVGDGLGGEGIYDELILLNELPFLDNKANYKFDAMARTIMRSTNIVSLPATGNTLGSIRAFVQSNLYSGFPVLNPGNIFVGYISRFELLRVIQENPSLPDDTACLFRKAELQAARDAQQHFIDLKEKLDVSPIQVRPSTPLRLILNMFRSLGLRYIIVLKMGELRGIITKKDLLQHIAIKFHKRIRTFLPAFEKITPLPLPKSSAHLPAERDIIHEEQHFHRDSDVDVDADVNPLAQHAI